MQFSIALVALVSTLTLTSAYVVEPNHHYARDAAPDVGEVRAREAYEQRGMVIPPSIQLTSYPLPYSWVLTS